MFSRVGIGAIAVLAISSPGGAATLVGAYSFNNTLASSVAGGPTLGAIDPTGTSSFGTDTVFGASRSVYNFRGTSANANQGGLTFAPTSSVTSNNYSIAMTFKFDDRQGAWRRILDVSGRSTDTGFYVDPSNRLNVFSVSGSNVAFNSGVYRNVVLTVDGTTIGAYIDGGQSFSTTSNVLTIGADPLIFFADNVLGGGQGEWSGGSIAALRVYDGVLGADEIMGLNDAPFVAAPVGAVPEPTTWGMMLLGFGAIGGATRYRRRKINVALSS
jgi:hypothetical protein